jgi:Predicted glutamine amidotransferase
MCAIVTIQKAGFPIEAIYRAAKAAFGTNPHGFGYTSNPDDGGEFEIRRIFKPEEGDFRHCAEVLHDRGGVLHARIASAGGVCPEGVHPFNAGVHRFLYMNGTLSTTRESLQKLGCANDSEIAARIVSGLSNEKAERALEFMSARFVLHDVLAGKIMITGSGWLDPGALPEKVREFGINICGCGAHEIRLALLQRLNKNNDRDEGKTFVPKLAKPAAASGQE